MTNKHSCFGQGHLFFFFFSKIFFPWLPVIIILTFFNPGIAMTIGIYRPGQDLIIFLMAVRIYVVFLVYSL